MTSNFSSLLSSDMVKLLSQGGESRFFVHKDILTSQSQPFRDALTGQWKEATEREVDLQDWDGATVGRMVEFLYWGTYQYPDPVPISPVGGTPALESGFIISASSETSGKSQTATSRGLTPPAGTNKMTNFMSSRMAGPKGNVKPIMERLKRFDPVRHDYGETLLSHAKVYQLAHFKAISPLRTLALENMKGTLSRIDPDTGPHNIVRIVEVARDVYANTDHLENHEEPLRSVVSLFIAHNFPALRLNTEMVNFLCEGGDIIIDVMTILSKEPSMVWPTVSPAPVSPVSPRYISRILFVSNSSDGAPHDHLRELNGGSAVVNSECGGSSGWLYAQYTQLANNACTGFSLDYSKRGPPYGVTVSPNHHLVQTSDPAIKRKITAAALFRSRARLENISDIPTHLGTYNAAICVLNVGQQGSHLYIVWQSVLVA